MVKTKIICTLGPASSNGAVVRKMIAAGMDVARINFSHGSFQERRHSVAMLRRLNKKYRRHIKILGDLEGFRIRIGDLKGGGPLELKKRQALFLTNRPVAGDCRTVPFDYKGSLTDIKKGSFIYIDDGTIMLRVKASKKLLLTTEVIVPGVLQGHKGVNIPDAELKFGGLSLKDKECINFCAFHNFEYIAQSFVRTREDILEIRNYLKGSRVPIKLIAKIENRQGIMNIEEILGVCDGIMIARGDMGVSLPIYEIPVVQKVIISKCNREKIPCITATQMLESMTEHSRPTRAEVTDVANAILDGTDFVMLSAETAVGKYPVECVRMMNDIIRFTEQAVKDKVV